MAPGRNAAFNPYGSGALLANNLHSTRGALAGAGFQGNLTANATANMTVLGLLRRTGAASSSSYHILSEPQRKRQKLDHEPDASTSSYIQSGAAGRDDIKNNKRKGKVQSSFFDAETVSSEEDTETVVPKARRDAFGPPGLDASPGSVDQIDLFNEQQSTRHLQKKHTRTAARAKTVPDPDKVIDVLDDDDDDEIQSASGLDDPKTVQDKRLRTTPNGHSLVTEGGVIELVKKYKRNERKASKPEKFTNKMQKRGGTKIKLLQQQTLGHLTMAAHTKPLDSVATSPSGFKGSGKHADDSSPPLLPLEAWTLGCEIFRSEDDTALEPVAWLRAARLKGSGWELQVVQRADEKGSSHGFDLHGTFERIKYTETPDDWGSESVAVIQLQSKASIKKMDNRWFKAGAKHAMGQVTFKFMHRHGSWHGGEEYRRLFDMLKQETKAIPDVLRSHRALACWDMVLNAVMHAALKAPGKTAAPDRETCSTASSAGPAKGSSTVVPSERSSVSVPPSR